MARHEPTVTRQCAYCETLFSTSEQHPRRFCSIACEEGRGNVPMSNPTCPDYHLYLKGNPDELVGRTVIAKALQLVNFSPEWAKGPDYTTPTDTIWVDEQAELYIRKDDVVVGRVVDYDGHYYIEREDMETGEIVTRKVKDMLLVQQLRKDRWWVE